MGLVLFLYMGEGYDISYKSCVVKWREEDGSVEMEQTMELEMLKHVTFNF